MDRLPLLSELDQARQRLNDVLTRVDERRELYPAWKLKEVYDHLGAWDEAVIVSLQSHARGEQPAVTAPHGLDAFNAEALNLRAARPLDASRRACEVARQALKALILSLPDERYAQPLLVPWDRVTSVTHVLEIFIHHEIEHAREIEEILNKAGG